MLSSIIAAATDSKPAQTAFGQGPAFNIGYAWMFMNCVVTAAYALLMRGRMKSLGFKDSDTMFYNNLLSIPVLAFASLFLEDWSAANLARNLCVTLHSTGSVPQADCSTPPARRIPRTSSSLPSLSLARQPSSSLIRLRGACAQRAARHTGLFGAALYVFRPR